MVRRVRDQIGQLELGSGRVDLDLASLMLTGVVEVEGVADDLVDVDRRVPVDLDLRWTDRLSNKVSRLKGHCITKSNMFINNSSLCLTPYLIAMLIFNLRRCL